MQNSEVTNKLRALTSKISSSAACTDTQSCMSDFVKITEGASLLRKVKHDVDSESLSSIGLNPWYKDECQERKKHFYIMLDNYRNVKK